MTANRCRSLLDVRMQIANDRIDEAALKAIGRYIAHLLRAGEVDTLATHFGYAVELRRGPIAAIREDLAECLG